jgi:hypothetical protein
LGISRLPLIGISQTDLVDVPKTGGAVSSHIGLISGDDGTESNSSEVEGHSYISSSVVRLALNIPGD